MLKKTVSQDKYALLVKFVDLGKKVNGIKKERKEILNSLFPGEDLIEETISVNVRGLSGVGFAVVRTISDKCDYKAIVETDYPEEKDLEKVKAKNSKPVATVKVKL